MQLSSLSVNSLIVNRDFVPLAISKCHLVYFWGLYLPNETSRTNFTLPDLLSPPYTSHIFLSICHVIPLLKLSENNIANRHSRVFHFSDKKKTLYTMFGFWLLTKQWGHLLSFVSLFIISIHLTIVTVQEL